MLISKTYKSFAFVLAVVEMVMMATWFVRMVVEVGCAFTLACLLLFEFIKFILDVALILQLVGHPAKGTGSFVVDIGRRRMFDECACPFVSSLRRSV